MILSGQASGLSANEAKVMVKMINLDTGNRWTLTRANFIDRRFMMQAIMRRVEQEDDDDDDDDDDDEDEKPDPFHHNAGHTVLGCATCFLDSLSYNIEFDEKVNIVDYKGRNEGQLHVSVYPVTSNGDLLNEDDVNEDPESLLGKEMNLKVTIHQAAGVRKFERLMVNFEDPYTKEQVKTAEISDPGDLTWNYTHQIKVAKVDRAFLDFITEGSMACFVRVWQSDEESGTDRQSHGNASKVSRAAFDGKQSLSSTQSGDVKEQLTSLLSDFQYGSRDGTNLAAAIEAIIEGRPIPKPQKHSFGPSVQDLQKRLEEAEKELRKSRRKSTLAIVQQRDRRASLSSVADIEEMEDNKKKQSDEGKAKKDDGKKNDEGKKEKKSKACTIS